MKRNGTDLIITAASSTYESSLLALIGSINVNWPNHPAIVVYDLGMGEDTCRLLKQAKIEVIRVPEFCQHWRKHFTWKIWCMRHAECQRFLWLDSGVCVLRSLDEMLLGCEKLGYCCSTIHWPLVQLMPKPLQIELGLNDLDLQNMVSINAGIFALKKDSAGKEFLDESLRIALKEECIKATEPLHRHDQAILSGLLYQSYSPLIFADFKTYAAWESPRETLNQRVWQHRRRLSKFDEEYFKSHVATSGKPHIPASLPQEQQVSSLKKIRIMIAKLRGRLPPDDRAGKTTYDGVRD